MDKRKFLLAAGAAAASLPALAANKRRAAAKPGDRKGARAAASGQAAEPAAAPKSAGQPAILTLAGQVGRSNRGPSDDALDQLMHKHGVRFDKAWTLSLADLLRLPATTIRTTLEYDGRVHELSGPQLALALGMAKVDVNAGLRLVMRAVDGYSPSLPVAEARARGMILATHLDGKPLALGGLGPLWAVYEADSQPDLRDKPLNERYAACPWGLYFIDVVA
ncbi:molybdopterin-dependent oxidoreductase [Ramlibacter sp. MAHUQ-53]|uniref:molybdopterin-dependent oxidoreductase n=1 Tax=unclassified Ramlibacter TaxID=2617605 RepID=UPI0036267FAC